MKMCLKKLISIISIVLSLSFVVNCSTNNGNDADTVFSNGHILTLDEAFSTSEAVAVKGGRIIAVGADSDIQAYIGEQTQIIDLKGNTMMPAMNDAHNHMGGFGIERPPFKLVLDYPNVESIADVVSAVTAKAASLKPGEWIQGKGWDEGYLAETLADPNRHPTKEDLDAVSPNNPVYLADFSHHVAWVNSAALALADITTDTLDPPDGIIVRDAHGEPTGILLESAAYLVSQLIPQWTREQLKQGMLMAYAEMNSLGYTSATDPGISLEDVDMYKEILDEGDATMRLNILISYSGGAGSVEAQKAIVDEAKTLSLSLNDEWLRIAGMKGLADGIPPSRTAWVSREYLAGGFGALFGEGETEAEKIDYWTDIIGYTNSAELQIGIHSTGDRTTDTIVNAYMQALDNHKWDARHYIIHGDFIQPATLELMGRYNIGVNVQTSIKWTISDHMETIVGVERSDDQWSVQSMLDAGIHVSNSSDATVTYPDWRHGIASAVLRESKATGKVSGADQRISVEDAIRTYTIGCAWQDHQDDIKGSIEVGKLADFCIIDQNILEIDPHDIPDIKVLLTVLGGEVVYRNPEGAFALP